MGALIASLVMAGMLALPPAAAGPAGDAAGSDHATTSELQRKLARLERKPSRESTANGEVTIGHSSRGRPIQLKEYGLADSGRRILVFGCIHGTECAGSALTHFYFGCPSPATIFFVPNLNPDGLALGTRLNAHGVDLNRNFPSQWKPIGQPWDLEYSGPKPLSEPESRLAAKLIQALHPDVTLWFHQEAEPMVRAWGPSVPAARRYARYSGLPFRHLPWPAGTATNWQNHHFRGTASFVVELPPGPLAEGEAGRLGGAVARLAG